MTKKAWKYLGGTVAALILFGAILAANYVTTDYGFVPIGFGLSATAGTFFAGFAIAARDAIQDTWGRWAVLGVIVLGTALSFAVSVPAIAIASAAAFGIGELLNFAVYTPIRTKSKLGDKRWGLAVVSSNIVGSIVDTVVFLGIAFGVASIQPALAGQLVGKFYATIVYLLIGVIIAYLLKRSANRRDDEPALSYEGESA